MSEQRVRTSTEVIDQAISENMAGQRLLYGLAYIFAIAGLSIIVWALANQHSIFAVIGMLTSILAWPAVNSIRKTKKESIAIRLLEVPLSRADTAKEASDMLQHLFQEIFRDEQQGDAQSSSKSGLGTSPQSVANGPTQK